MIKQLFLLIMLLLFNFQAVAQTTNAKNTALLARYKMSLQSEKNHQFNENQIRSFVYYWFSLHDQHAAIEKSYELLDKNHLLMKYPEITVRNLKDYKTWYTNVGNNIKNNQHIVKNLEVRMLDHHQYQVDVIVNWQAIDKNDQFINVTATQCWLLVDDDSNSHPYIKEYRVLRFEPNGTSFANKTSNLESN